MGKARPDSGTLSSNAHTAAGEHRTDAPPTESTDTWRSSYRRILGVREFQALWLSHALSMMGGNLLGLAMTVLVYQQTSSALAAGFTLALTFLPPIIAGPLLSGYADIFPRRRVLLISDVARAAVVAAIALPGLPLGVLWGLLFLAILPLVPFSAARAALLADIVQGDRYVAGSAIINMTSHAGALVGLLLGGAVLPLIQFHATVLLNSGIFLLSALIVALGVHARPAPNRAAEARPKLWELTRDGGRLVFSDPRLRTLTLIAWLAGFYVIPLGIANPLATATGGGAAAVSVIMASVPAGALIGGFVLTRLIDPRTRIRLIGPLALLSSLPLLAFVFQPPLWVVALLLVASGMFGAHQLVANAAFVLCVPSSGRGLAFGLVASGLQAVQGIGIVLGSLLVGAMGSYATIALAGGCGVLAATALLVPWRRFALSVTERMHDPESPDQERPQ